MCPNPFVSYSRAQLLPTKSHHNLQYSSTSQQEETMLQANLKGDDDR